jgi:DNA replication protein DnaC
MSDNAKRAATVTPISDALGGLELRNFFGSKDWTDEQWAAHDAEVAIKLANANKDAENERVWRIAKGFADAGWPARALDSAKVADETKPAVARVLSWDTKVENVLVLSGQPGCGKTTAAAVWAQRRNQAPAFVRATTFASSSRYDRDTRDAWLHANALVLDDLGAEYADAKGNFLVDLDELIDTFYGDKRPLLITTNCTDVEFKQRYGARIVDRIRECGSFFGIRTTSLRGKS